MLHLLKNVLLATSLALVPACYSGYFYSDNPYSQLLDHEAVLRQSSDLGTNWNIGASSWSGYSDEDGFHNVVSLAAEFECQPAQLEAFAQALHAYLEEDIFGSGFHLTPEASKVEALASSGGLGPRATIDLEWESANSRGSLNVTITTGARSGLFDLALRIDERAL
ncbi:MAG: hypothetical protein P1V81_00920 [Planctomycetota bacterium]|nr:hypothetical protein [Planctomycetota bacterium]